MSSETLSQSEIDALLGGSGPAAQPTPTVQRGGAAEVQVYDFRRPHRISKERLRTLVAMYERLVKSLEGWLMGRARGHLEMRLQSVEQYSFGEFALSLPTPCASYILDIHDSGGQQGIIDLGHDFAYFLVDRLFGGSGEPTIPNRGLTPLERMAIRGGVERIAALLSEVWQDYVQLDLAIGGFESIPDILRAVNREDPVLVANVEVSAGSMNSLILLCLPFSVLETFFSSGPNRNSESVTGSERERAVNRIVTEKSLRATRVSVAARLAEFRLPMRELAALRVGGVLATGIPIDAELEVRVGTQPRFRAAPGRVGRQLAVRLLESLETSEEELSSSSSESSEP